MREYKDIMYSYTYDAKKMEYKIYFEANGCQLHMIIVSPREIDYLMESLCKVSINTALWYNLIKEEIKK